MMNRRLRGEARGRAWAAAVAAVMVATLSACSGSSVDDAAPEEAAPESTDYFGYLVESALLTSNAASADGASVNAEALSGRLYPAVFVPGPLGQMIPNTDLATTQVLPGAHRQVVYTLAEDATYSDGTPVTCTDFLLHYKAGVHEGLFGSHLPQTEEVVRLDCEPAQKRFTVVFDTDAGGRWRHLFGPGTVLPAHAIAARAGLTLDELHTALQNDDFAVLGEVAPIWRDGFDLAAFDPQLQVSSGPFVIDRVGEDGEVVLVPNEHFDGDAPNLDTVVMWPKGTEPERLTAAGALRVADIRGGGTDWVNRDDPMNRFDIEDRVGDLTDTLFLGNAGSLAGPWSRQAFAACVDQRAVAAASSQASGVEVPPVAIHTLPHYDPLAAQLADVGDPHLAVDIPKATGISGATIRIGYTGPDDRKAAMVEAIRASCEPAGVTVVDASAESGGSLANITRVTTGAWGEEVVHDGELNAVLMAVDPMAEFGAASARASELAYLRTREEELWELLPSIPLSAQPRRFVIDRTVGNVVVYTGPAGIGWNMDRWLSEDDGAERDSNEQVQ